MWINRVMYNNLLNTTLQLSKEILELRKQYYDLERKTVNRRDFDLLMQHLNLSVVNQPEKLLIKPLKEASNERCAD